MPELDSDLFQWATLALLGLTVLVLLLALLTLGRIRRAIERNTAMAKSPAESSGQPEQAPTEARERADAESGLEETSRRVAATPTPRPEASSEHGAISQGQESVADTREHAAVAPQEQPLEQPFERDGRWWFRRAGELLVYDERTGHWGPAPTQAPSETIVSAAAHGPGGGAPVTGGSVDQDAGDVTTAGPVQRAETPENGPADQGSFWKCRSCGAVNDATASTCRMCFTPKGLA